MKISKIILLLIVIIFTSLLIFLKPKMHKPIRIENSDFEVGETIAWNSWYSDVSNELLNTVHLPEEEAVNISDIYVKFEVDKNGNIESISTGTTPSQYFAVAEKYVIPAIKALQGKSVLIFPTKSKRKIVTYSTTFKLSDKTKYTTPSDFQSYEKINQR